MTLRFRWSRTHRGREHRFLQRFTVFLFAFGWAALGTCALAWFGAAFSERYAERQFDQSLARIIPSHGAAEFTNVSRLEVPRLGVTVMVREGVDSGILRTGAGHLPGSAQPGSPGNVVIAAHRDTFFRELRHIRPDDTIVLDTLRGTYRYSVEWTRIVNPSDLEVLDATSESELTLVTCYPFYYVGPAPDRFIVRAQLLNPIP